MAQQGHLESGESATQDSSNENTHFEFSHTTLLASAMLKNMNQHRTTEEFCDITLVVGENLPEEIKAHKLVLSSFSRYFEGLLKPNMKEGHQDQIEIKNLSGSIVKKLIDFAYTGQLEITTENIESMFEAANFLAIDSACTGCCTFMTRHMDRSNCIGVLRCAELYSQKELRNAAFNMASKNFSSVIKGDEFYALPTDIVRDFISSEYLGMRGLKLAQREKLVLDTVLRYLRENQLEESSDAVLLFEHVRLPLLEKGILIDLEKSELVSKNESVKELVQSRGKVRARRVYDDTAEAWMRPRRHHGIKVMETARYGEWTETYPYDDVHGFSDEAQGRDSYVRGMTIYLRHWHSSDVIAGVEVLYASGERTMHGGRWPGGGAHEFTLEDNERIVDVTIRSGWSIDQLGFVTNQKQRKIGPFGGNGGSERRIAKPSAKQYGFLKYITGCTSYHQGGYVLRGLRMYFGYYDYE